MVHQHDILKPKNEQWWMFFLAGKGKIYQEINIRQDLAARLLPDGLLPLGLTDLRLLVPLGHDLSQGGASDSPLELHCAACTLLCHLFLS